jgi:hypothetical protein
MLMIDAHCTNIQNNSDHRRQKIATTSGHPARWNEKTLALFDNFVQELYERNIKGDNRFKQQW